MFPSQINSLSSQRSTIMKNKILMDTRAILAKRWPESVYLIDKMSVKAQEDKAYATAFSEYLESGGTLALRDLVTDWEVLADDAIGGYTLDFSLDVAALDAAHFAAIDSQHARSARI